MIKYFYCSEYWLHLLDLNAKKDVFEYSCAELLKFNNNNTNHCTTIKDACHNIISCLNINKRDVKYNDYYIVEYNDEYLSKYGVLSKESNIIIHKFENYYDEYKYLLLLG